MAPVLSLLLALVAGRLGLLLLPSGEAGTRSPFGASDTLAPVLVLGLAVREFGAVLGVGDLALVALALLALLRLALGPAALVPRHERVEAPLPQTVRWTNAALWILALVFAVALELPGLAASVFVAWLFRAALERLAVALPLRSVGAACAFMLAVGATSQTRDAEQLIAFALAFGAGALATGWVRRADRRDLALACLAAAAVPSPVSGIVLLAGVFAATRRASLARSWVLVGLGLIGVRAVAGDDLVVAAPLPSALGAGAGLVLVAIARARDVRRGLDRTAAA